MQGSQSAQMAHWVLGLVRILSTHRELPVCCNICRTSPGTEGAGHADMGNIQHPPIP